MALVGPDRPDDEVRLWGQSRPRRCGHRLPKMTHPRHDGTLPSGVAPFEKGSSNARLPSTKKHKVIFGGPDHRLGNPGRAGLASREEYAACSIRMRNGDKFGL